MNKQVSVPSVFVQHTVTVSFGSTFVLAEFLKTRSGLYVSESFRALVVAKAKPIEAGQAFTFRHQTLKHRDEGWTNAEIKLELGENHIFNEIEASVIVGGLIMQQPKGEVGALLNDGKANLLYLPSCVVNVYWYAGNRDWHVHTWDRGDGGWLAGNRVFSPAN